MADAGLRAIFLEQRAMLLRLLTARLGSREDAEDALQDMWLRVEQLADQPVAQPAAFLYRVATNLATDRRIAASRRGARDTACDVIGLPVTAAGKDVGDARARAYAGVDAIDWPGGFCRRDIGS